MLAFESSAYKTHRGRTTRRTTKHVSPQRKGIINTVPAMRFATYIIGRYLGTSFRQDNTIHKGKRESLLPCASLHAHSQPTYTATLASETEGDKTFLSLQIPTYLTSHLLAATTVVPNNDDRPTASLCQPCDDPPTFQPACLRVVLTSFPRHPPWPIPFRLSSIRRMLRWAAKADRRPAEVLWGLT